MFTMRFERWNMSVYKSVKNAVIIVLYVRIFGWRRACKDVVEGLDLGKVLLFWGWDIFCGFEC